MPELARQEQDEVESTRAEKLLALGFAAFLLVGGFWVMDRLGSIPKAPDYGAIAAAAGLPALEAQYRQAENDLARAQEAASVAAGQAEQARSDYEFKREEYRVALERGVDDPALAQAHDAARLAFEQASARAALAQATLLSFSDKLTGPQAAFGQAQLEVSRDLQRAENRYQLALFGLRFGYALPLFGLAVWLWFVLRRRRVRYLVLATAFVGFAGIQALALVGQYGWYLLRDIGPIALSVSGSAVCVAGLVALRRWATSTKRVVTVRLRRGQCPFCGFPLVAGADYCAGCGTKATEACPGCGTPNVARSAFCSHCGRTLA